MIIHSGEREENYNSDRIKFLTRAHMWAILGCKYVGREGVGDREKDRRKRETDRQAETSHR
jgi:hypothetical protein